MPHIHLHTSADLVENVDLPDILRELADELSRQESIDSKAVKAYHSLHQTWAMGEGAPNGFAHCRISLLEGRPEDLRKRIAEAMYSRLKACFESTVRSGEASLTLELLEMDAATYRKL
jgi:5-carboxymethyl-2-hydroxymuconate isomerase